MRSLVPKAMSILHVVLAEHSYVRLRTSSEAHITVLLQHLAQQKLEKTLLYITALLFFAGKTRTKSWTLVHVECRFA